MVIFPHDLVPQGGENWFRLRLGRPTASEFDKILTPAKGQKSTAQRGYAARHVDERVTGGPVDVKPAYSNPDMERGHSREHEAAMRFEHETGFLTRKVGFVATDDGRFGASPDRLVYLDEDSPEPFACLEVKNYNANDHLLWQEDGGLPNDFKCQTHGEMIVTGLKACYWLQNCPPYDPIILRVDWDDFTTKLAEALDEFDRTIFRPMLAKICENAAIRAQVEEFDREYERMLSKARSLK